MSALTLGTWGCVLLAMVVCSGKDILVGHAAAEQAEHNPQNTVYDAKRFIGKGFTDEELQKEVGRYPFQVGRRRNGRPGTLVTFLWWQNILWCKHFLWCNHSDVNTFSNEIAFCDVITFCKMYVFFDVDTFLWCKYFL